jgi:hypothetical protein
MAIKLDPSSALQIAKDQCYRDTFPCFWKGLQVHQPILRRA